MLLEDEIVYEGEHNGDKHSQLVLVTYCESVVPPSAFFSLKYCCMAFAWALWYSMVTFLHKVKRQ
jgi:hypothetical protein